MAETDRDWWRGCSIYQIYPRSFQDTTGDGVGDLKGVVRRLHHAASLGVDAGEGGSSTFVQVLVDER